MTAATLDVTTCELEPPVANAIVVALAFDLGCQGEALLTQGPIVDFNTSPGDLHHLADLTKVIANSVSVLDQLEWATHWGRGGEETVTLTTTGTMLLHIAKRLKFQADQELFPDGSEEAHERFVAALRAVAGILADS